MAPLVARARQTCFMVCAWDGPGADALRARDLDGHLAHMEAHWQRYLIAGPLREPEGETIIGSMFLVWADSHDNVTSLMAGDPYFTNGQYRQVEVRRFVPAIGTAIGGRTWESADAIRSLAAGGPPLPVAG
jgi:uncharacterized protein